MTQLWGTATRSGEGYDLSFERIYPTTVDDVWDAVTDRERLARWMAPYTGDLRLGGTWRALSSDGSVFSWGTVSECEAPHRFVTSWEYEGEHVSTIVVTVSDHPEGARLVLEHRGLVDVGYGAGWQTYLEQLDDALGAAPSSPQDAERAAGIGWDARYQQLAAGWRARIEAVLA